MISLLSSGAGHSHTQCVYDTIRFAWHDVFVIGEWAYVRDMVHALQGVTKSTCEA